MTRRIRYPPSYLVELVRHILSGMRVTDWAIDEWEGCGVHSSGVHWVPLRPDSDPIVDISPH